MRPRLLDLFCKAGGASVGYHRAGFEVIGVDIAPQPNYPYRFIQADAIDLLTSWVGGGHWFYELPTVAAWHASPPCQRYSSMTKVRGNPADHPDLVAPTRALLMATGLPYAIENVKGAPLQDAITLCGSMFGLGATCIDGQWRQLRRHRLFEGAVPLLVSPCQHRGGPVGVYGGGGQRTTASSGNGHNRGYMGNKAERIEAMGIDWMTGAELSQAIPPAYNRVHRAQTHGGDRRARMRPYHQTATQTFYHGDVLTVLQTMPADSVRLGGGTQPPAGATVTTKACAECSEPVADSSRRCSVGDNDAAAWAIVRRLATSVHLERHGSTGEIRCMYCNDLHTPDCLWRNAKEVLDAQA